MPKFVVLEGMSCEGDDNFTLSIDELKAVGWSPETLLYEISSECYWIGFELPDPMPKGWSINKYGFLMIDGKETDARLIDSDNTHGGWNIKFEGIGCTSDDELVATYHNSSWRDHWRR